MDGGRGEGQEEEKIGHEATQAARLNLQRIEKCVLRQQAREEMVSSASRSRNGGKACGVNLVIGSVREARAEKSASEHMSAWNTRTAH
jgi:hypothetical protein